MHSTKRVEIDLSFVGDGRIIEGPRGMFRGGVPDPELSDRFGFNMLPDDGGPAASPGLEPHAGSLQVNIWGTGADFRELGRYLLAIAELDTTVDPGFHQHHEDLRTEDGRTTVQLIVRKILE